MNTYDPDDDVVYVHLPLARTGGLLSRSRDSRRTQRLPCGYANRSPGTRLPARVLRFSSDLRRDPAVAEGPAAASGDGA